jgi:hypothetical protein
MLLSAELALGTFKSAWEWIQEAWDLKSAYKEDLRLLQDLHRAKLLSSIESSSPPVLLLMLSRRSMVPLSTLAKIIVVLPIPPPMSATEKLKDVLAVEPHEEESLG